MQKFISLLRPHGIVNVVDIRTYPSSRHCPQFNTLPFEKAIVEAGMVYLHMPKLGGRRPKTKANSTNTGWKNLSFRNFADYMESAKFSEGLSELEAVAVRPSVIVCTESVPWKCHRSLVGDALTAHGWTVLDIMESKTVPHRTTEFFKYDAGKFSYPERA